MLFKNKKHTSSYNYWPNITTPEEADSAIDSAMKGLYTLLVIQAIGHCYLKGPTAIIEPIIIASLAFGLAKTKSHLISIVILLWSIIVLFITIYNSTHRTPGNGVNVFLAIFGVVLSITLYRATLSLNAKKKETDSKEIEKE